MPNPIGVFPSTNIDSSDEASTISGIAIARKITKFVTARPLNWYRPSTSPISAPSTVAMIDAGSPRGSMSSAPRSGSGSRTCPATTAIVQQVNSAICRSPRRSLNENRIMTKTGNAR